MSKLLKSLLIPFLNLQLRAVEGEGGADDSEAVGTNNDARIAMLNGIADGNDRGRADELADVNDDDTTSTFTPPAGEEEPAGGEAETAEQIEAREATDAQAAIDAAAAAAPAQKYKLKVNGQEIELTLDEMRERAQKVSSADDYLREAARIKNEATQQQKQAPSKDELKVDDDLALARAIQMGDESEAVAAIRKLRSTGPSVDDLRNTVNEQLNFKEAISKFQSEYADLTGDPVLHKLVLDKDRELIASGDRRPYYERYSEIGNNVRAWKGSLVKPTADAQAFADKKDRKASAPAVPAQAAGKTQQQVVEDKEESTSDVIAGMAAKRGGPQWMQGQR
ncbi:MAG: hypothetical protein JWR07_1916 [Nevskia sp.]|nr:hypothetical protein [Nevskia sp.]